MKIDGDTWKQAAKKWRAVASSRNWAYNQASHERDLERKKWIAAEATATRLRGLVEEFEWVECFVDNGGYDDHWDHRCPKCLKSKDEGHADDCELAKELKDRDDN